MRKNPDTLNTRLASHDKLGLGRCSQGDDRKDDDQTEVENVGDAESEAEYDGEDSDPT